MRLSPPRAQVLFEAEHADSRREGAVIDAGVDHFPPCFPPHDRQNLCLRSRPMTDIHPSLQEVVGHETPLSMCSAAWWQFRCAMGTSSQEMTSAMRRK